MSRARIDPANTWRKVAARLETETNPRRRKNLQTLLAHMQAESRGDLDALLATVADRAHYRTHASGEPFMSPNGKAAVREFYEAFIASGASRLELDVERLVVDDDCVVTEGVLRIAYPGGILQSMGHAVDDADGFYLYEAQTIIVWPMDQDSLVLGEDTYVAGDGFAGIAERKLRPEDLTGVDG